MKAKQIDGETVPLSSSNKKKAQQTKTRRKKVMFDYRLMDWILLKILSLETLLKRIISRKLLSPGFFKAFLEKI